MQVRIMIAVSVATLLVLGNVNLAQAGTSADAVPSIGRTTTGRPADIDSRIPWLSDLGLAQCGGPELMLPTETFSVEGSVDSLALLGDDVALVIDGKPDQLILVSKSGETRWSQRLAPHTRWKLLSDDKRIYAVPQKVYPFSAEKGQVNILVFDASGKKPGELKWPLGPDYLSTVELKDGVIIGQYGDRRRIGRRISPGKLPNLDEILMQEDLRFGWGIEKSKRRRAIMEGKVVIGTYVPDPEEDPEPIPGTFKKRKKRAAAWIGRALHIDELPLFSSDDDRFARSIRPWEVVKILKGDGLWVQFMLFNPLNAPLKDLLCHTCDRTPPRYRPLVARFDRRGRMKCYVFIPLGAPYFVKGPSLIFSAVTVRDGTVTSTVQRWEPLK